MNYNVELVSSVEHYSVNDENGKDYRLDFYYEENVGWETVEIFDDETDENITDTEKGKEILEAFKNR